MLQLRYIYGLKRGLTSKIQGGGDSGNNVYLFLCKLQQTQEAQ